MHFLRKTTFNTVIEVKYGFICIVQIFSSFKRLTFHKFKFYCLGINCKSFPIDGNVDSDDADGFLRWPFEWCLACVESFTYNL